MPDPTGSVAWIAIAPVKSMALTFLDAVTVGPDGIAGDRAFAVVDAEDRVVNGKRAGQLALVRATFESATRELTLQFPDGRIAVGVAEPGDSSRAIFSGHLRPARSVSGPWSEAVSEWAGRPLRVVAIEPGQGPDRGPTVSLLSTAALAALATAGGTAEPLDRRRFRMTFGIDGVAAYAEDGWLGRTVRIGAAIVNVAGNIGRCAVTTHDPDSGRPSFDTLRVLQVSRGHLATSEPLPFGVWAEVVSPGNVALGDPIVAG